MDRLGLPTGPNEVVHNSMTDHNIGIGFRSVTMGDSVDNHALASDVTPVANDGETVTARVSPSSNESGGQFISHQRLLAPKPTSNDSSHPSPATAKNSKKPQSEKAKEKADKINSLNTHKKTDSDDIVSDAEPIFPSEYKGKTIRPPRFFNKRELAYGTTSYAFYDFERDNRPPRTIDKNPNSFDQYNDYTLVSCPDVNTVEEFKALKLPTEGIRLDDKMASLAARSGMSIESLHEAFPAEFDRLGDIRARRVPLGEAAKAYFPVGARDLKGRELKEGQDGFYYLWHRGITLLCGDEGFDRDTYLVRPSYYDRGLKTTGTYFLKEFKAVVQAERADRSKRASKPNRPKTTNSTLSIMKLACAPSSFSILGRAWKAICRYQLTSNEITSTQAEANTKDIQTPGSIKTPSQMLENPSYNSIKQGQKRPFEGEESVGEEDAGPRCKRRPGEVEGGNLKD